MNQIAKRASAKFNKEIYVQCSAKAAFRWCEDSTKTWARIRIMLYELRRFQYKVINLRDAQSEYTYQVLISLIDFTCLELNNIWPSLLAVTSALHRIMS